MIKPVTIWCYCISFYAISLPAVSASLSIEVVDANGQPVKDAVLELFTDGQTESDSKVATTTYQVVQKNARFKPFVLVIPVGAHVSFPNKDNTRHHVYSFSPANTFELRLYKEQTPKPVHFPSAGVIHLGCNIHDWMISYILVSEAKHYLQTGITGQARLENLPPKKYKTKLWHPWQLSEIKTDPITIQPTNQQVMLKYQLPINRKLERHPPKTRYKRDGLPYGSYY